MVRVQVLKIHICSPDLYNKYSYPTPADLMERCWDPWGRT